MNLTEEQKSKICGKQIIIVEAPAGAGKTTLVNRLSKIDNVGIVQGSLGKRSFEIEEASHKSFFNDTNKLMQALSQKNGIIFIDRCFASQVVYDAIRRRKNETPKPDKLTDTAMLLALELEDNLAWRCHRDPLPLDMGWMFLIPTAAELRNRRILGGKEYPNHPEVEIFHYKNISNHLLGERAFVMRPSYEGIKDQDYLVETVTTWASMYPYSRFDGLWRIMAGVPQCP